MCWWSVSPSVTQEAQGIPNGYTRLTISSINGMQNNQVIKSNVSFGSTHTHMLRLSSNISSHFTPQLQLQWPAKTKAASWVKASNVRLLLGLESFLLTQEGWAHIHKPGVVWCLFTSPHQQIFHMVITGLLGMAFLRQKIKIVTSFAGKDRQQRIIWRNQSLKVPQQN